ncbi:MAG: EAL domain-containing protein [Spirochaetota bacterium]|mgnify:CR=1 FL=1
MSTSPIRILLVEDYKAYADLIAEYLGENEQFDFQVLTAGTLAEAVATLAETTPDCILLDLTLPDGTGTETLVKMQAYAGHIPIVVLTGMDDEALSIDSAHLGAKFYLTKTDVNAGLLVRTIVYAVERRAMEHALRERESALEAEKERLSVTLEAIGDAVISTDTRGVITYVNTAAGMLFGVVPADVVGEVFQDFFSAMDEATRTSLEENPVLRTLSTGIGLKTKALILTGRNGRESMVECSVSPIKNPAGGIIGTVVVLRDVSVVNKMLTQITYQTSHDVLTGLYNRKEFETAIERLIEDARSGGKSHSLCYLDLDKFKVINDTAGHAAGDKMILTVTSVLRSIFPDAYALARTGDDEFGVLFSDCPAETAALYAERLRTELSGCRFEYGGDVFSIRVSIGVIGIDNGSSTVSAVLAAVDEACHLAKENGGNRVHVHNPDDKLLLRRHAEMQWIARITETVEESRFVLYRQEIVPVRGGRETRRHEVLLRMIDRDTGRLVMPLSFIPALERFSIMPTVDRWVIENAFALYAKHDVGPREEFAINISGLSLNDPGFAEYILERLESHGVPAGAICLEITETAAIQNITAAARFVKTLRKRGIHFALDDFGAGLSTFDYLKNLPVDYLKIDGHFIKYLFEDPVYRAIVQSINTIGHIMGIRTVAEYVETEEHFKAVEELGIDYAQGYHIAYPVRW